MGRAAQTKTKGRDDVKHRGLGVGYAGPSQWRTAGRARKSCSATMVPLHAAIGRDRIRNYNQPSLSYIYSHSRRPRQPTPWRIPTFFRWSICFPPSHIETAPTTVPSGRTGEIAPAQHAAGSARGQAAAAIPPLSRLSTGSSTSFTSGIIGIPDVLEAVGAVPSSKAWPMPQE